MRIAGRVGAGALVLALAFGVTGCSTLKKFTEKVGEKFKSQPADTAGGAPPPRFPSGGGNPTPAPAPTTTQTGAVTSTANQGALLAGRVIDGYSRPPGNTSIRWVSLDDNKETENDVSVTPEGYFTIQGLKPGGHYKLVARGKQGDRLVAGISYTTAPNIRVLIQVKDEFANGTTPPVQGAPAASPQDNPAKTSNLGNNPGGWSPTMGVPGATGADGPDLPVAISVGNPARSTAPPAQNWTPSGDGKNQSWPPTLEVPRSKTPLPPLQIPGASAPPELKSPPAFPAAVGDALTTARVPSCVRVGDRIVNFALNDVNGQPWELRHRKGKLVLVDFWRTDCVPCLNSLPYLKDLQTRYGSQGLEVVGIANETEGSQPEQAYRVMSVAKRHGLNYRQLLSSGLDCPVRREFRISIVPTLYLLDEQGFIVWRSDPNLAPSEQRAELERLIQRRLSQRAL
jgi:thiol-disulfide isomerase/thioredoxin